MSEGGSRRWKLRRSWRVKGARKEWSLVMPTTTHERKSCNEMLSANPASWRKLRARRMAGVCGRQYFLQQIYYCFTISVHTTQTGKLHNCHQVTWHRTASSSMELVATYTTLPEIYGKRWGPQLYIDQILILRLSTLTDVISRVLGTDSIKTNVNLGNVGFKLSYKIKNQLNS